MFPKLQLKAFWFGIGSACLLSCSLIPLMVPSPVNTFSTSGLDSDKVLVETLHLNKQIPFPSGLAFHPIRKSLFVTSRSRDQRLIYEVEPQTGQVREWKSGGSILPPTSYCPDFKSDVSVGFCSIPPIPPEDIPSIAIDSQGHIFLSFTYSNLGLFSLVESKKSQIQQIKLVSPGSIENPIVSVFPSNDQSKFKDEPLNFNGIQAIALDTQGHIFLIDGGNFLIRKIINNFVYNVVGYQSFKTEQDGQANEVVAFAPPLGLVVNQRGDIFLKSGQFSSTVRKISKDGQVSTFADFQEQKNSVNFKNGTRTNAHFNLPTGITIDQADNLYISDTANRAIRKITPEGVVSTLAGQASPNPTNTRVTPLLSSSSLIDGPGSEARFASPIGLALDDQGGLYVADLGNQAIRRIKPIGEQKK